MLQFFAYMIAGLDVAYSSVVVALCEKRKYSHRSESTTSLTETPTVLVAVSHTNSDQSVKRVKQIDV